MHKHSQIKREFAQKQVVESVCENIETSFISREHSADMFANYCCGGHIRQLVFANTSLQTLVFRLKAPLLHGTIFNDDF